MEKKQTAVQFLLNELTVKERNLVNKTFITLNKSLAGNILRNLFDKALQMEREQIEEAFDEGDCNGTFETINRKQYYTQTFKP